jgi:hypothetical protein
VRRDTGKYLNWETATHKFPIGAYVLHQVGVLSRKETFRVTRLLPDDGAGFQYRIKGERKGFERVAKGSRELDYRPFRAAGVLAQLKGTAKGRAIAAKPNGV